MIRAAALTDAELISELNIDVQRVHAQALPKFFKPPSTAVFPADDVRELLADPAHHFFLSYAGDEPAGYVYAEERWLEKNSFRYALKLLYIHHISVRPSFRQQGHGRALLDAVKSLAREKGIDTIALDVWSFNKAAHAFFRREGWQTFNERMWLHLE